MSVAVAPAKSASEPEWLQRRRQEGHARFDALPWPAATDDAWRRTPTAVLDWPSLPLTPAKPQSSGPVPEDLLHISTDGWQDGGLLVHRNTQAVVLDTTPGVLRTGIVFKDLATAIQQYRQLVEPLLGTDPTLYTEPLAKLNALSLASWTHGTFIYVPRNVPVTLPVRIVHLADSAGGLLAPRTLIVLEPGSELTVVEETYAAPGDRTPYVPAVVELVVRAGASLRYYHLQNWGPATRHFYTQHATVERDGRLTSLLTAIGSRLAKASVEARLIGAGARSDLYGVAFGDGAQHLEYHTLQDHLVGRTTSDLLYKTALKDQAVSLFIGLIRIAEGAPKSDAYQANRNLLLSPEAKADAIPMLEILTDDVRCTHGTTVGPVDAEQLFYLTSRGVPPASAERMLVDGFFEDVFQRIPSAGLRERLHAHIERKLGAH